MTQPTPTLDAQDLSKLAILLTRINEAVKSSGLSLGDVVVYDDGEPLGTIVTQDGNLGLKQEA